MNSRNYLLASGSINESQYTSLKSSHSSSLSRNQSLFSFAHAGHDHHSGHASDPGNSRNKALSIPTPGRKTHKGTVGKSDPDFFRLTLDRESQVTITLRNTSQETINFAALDNRGKVAIYGGQRVTATIQPGQKRVATFSNVASGTYFLRVTSTGADNSYTLITAATTIA